MKTRPKTNLAEWQDAEAAADRELVEKFYTMCHMVGLNKVQTTAYAGPTFLLDNVAYSPKSSCDEALYGALGGRSEALKLLVYCEMVTVLCNRHKANYPEAFGVVSGSMLDVVERYPLLRVYYEKAQLGGTFHTWWKAKRASAK